LIILVTSEHYGKFIQILPTGRAQVWSEAAFWLGEEVGRGFVPVGADKWWGSGVGG
jgi:hypothetical protein